MSEMGSAGPGTRAEQLAWLRAQAESHQIFTKAEKEFLTNELKVDPNSDGFTADLKHIENAAFRSKINTKMHDFPPFRGKKLHEIRKAGEKANPHLIFVWRDHASTDPTKLEAPAEESVLVEYDSDYRYVEEFVKNNRVEKLILIQHWGQSTSTLRDELLKHPHGEIELYLQNPDKGCCKRQKGKISDHIAAIFKRAAIPRSAKEQFEKRVKVFVFDVPASIRAILVDDKLLALGWYVYYPVPPIRSKTDYDEEDTYDIMGRDLPTIYAKNGWTGYTNLKGVVDYWLDEIKKERKQIYPPTNDP